MKFCRPKIYVLGETRYNEMELLHYFRELGAERWLYENSPEYEGNIHTNDGELITEIMARGCYKSFGIGLNPNVTKVREGNKEYLENILNVGHGSVLEHVVINFMFYDVSRVFTHELVRHRVGTAISQESLRYVRLTELKCFDFPRLEDELSEEEEKWFRKKTEEVFRYLEDVQDEMSVKFNLNDEQSFARKKKLTSRMRRLAPLGLLTSIGWSANLRTLRFVIPLRTSKAAEEEMRFVFCKVGEVCKSRFPSIFQDMEFIPDNINNNVDGLGEWTVKNKKV